MPLNGRLRLVLGLYRQDTGFIVHSEDGAPGRQYRCDYKKAFATVARAAGVPWCTPHVLRHTFASQLVQAGVSLYKISRWLGHASIRTTEVYAHLSPYDSDIDRIG